MSDNDVKEAFDAYRADPGGEVRIDTAAIAAAGRKRVRRNQILMGVAGVVVLVGAAIAVPSLVRNDEEGVSVAAELPPASGRDLNTLFEGARGWSPEVKTQAGGPAKQTAEKFVSALGIVPASADTAWQAAPEGSKPGSLGAVFTWVDGDKAAEGVLTVNNNPVHTMIFPPPYTVCSDRERGDGKTCAVKEIKGKGWLKETTTATGALRVSLQADGGPGIDFLVTDGAATRAELAGGKQPMGKLPVDKQAVIDAVLSLA